MEAPLYLPAESYEPPTLVPRELSVDSISVGDLLANPVTRAIVLAEPEFAKRLDHPTFRAHLFNFTLRSISEMGGSAVSRGALDRVDLQLRALPPEERQTL